MSELEVIKDLLLPKNLYRQYPLKRYIDYCEQIRDSIWGNRHLDKKKDKTIINFFENQFVDEMEPLARVAQAFSFSSKDVRIEYVKPGEDPPDGRIYVKDEIIQVEFTTSVDKRLLEVCLELNRKAVRGEGDFVSFTGHRSDDIIGTKNKGHELKGESVECVDLRDEFETIALKRIRQCLEKKLRPEKEWKGNNHWLCVLMDDTNSSHYEDRYHYANLVIPHLDMLANEYEQELQDKGIDILFFVGHTFFLRYYPIEPKPHYVSVPKRKLK